MPPRRAKAFGTRAVIWKSGGVDKRSPTKGKGKEKEKEKEKAEEEDEIVFKFESRQQRSHRSAGDYVGDCFTIVTVQCMKRTSPGQDRWIEVGKCVAEWINRNEMRRDFQPALQRFGLPFKLATDLFDQQGYLRQRYLDEGPIRGQGVWDKTLGYGPLLRIREIVMNEQYMDSKLNVDRKIEKQLVLGVIALVVNNLDMGTEFVFAEMGQVPYASLFFENEQSAMDTHKRHFGLYQELGFRRVGLTHNLCFAVDPEHPSRRLPPDEYDQEAVFDSFLKIKPTEFPGNLRDMLLSYSSTNAKKVFDYLKGESAEHPLPKDFDFYQTDARGNTLLHNTVQHYPGLTEYLAKKYPKMLTMRNKEGETPWDLFLNILYTKSSTMERLPMIEPNMLKGGFNLRKAMGATEEELNNFFTQYKYGCDCGKCLGGLVSQKALFDLGVGAEMAARHIREDLAKTNISDPKYFRNLPSLVYFPRALRIRPVASEAFYLEVARTLDELAPLLMTGHLPTESEVREISPKYFNTGGQLRYLYQTMTPYANKFSNYCMREMKAPKFLRNLLDRESGIPTEKELEQANKRGEEREKIGRCAASDGDFMKLKLYLFGFNSWGSVRSVNAYI